MSDLPKNFDFNKLNSISVLRLPEETLEYTLGRDMVLTGQAVVPEDSDMASITVSNEFKAGTKLEGIIEDNAQPDFPKIFTFEWDGGKLKDGKKYEGKVFYSFLLEDAETQKELATLKEEIVKKNKIHFMVKGLVLGASVGAGYGFAKIIKKKPLIPMIVAPVIALAGLLVADSIMQKNNIKNQ